MIPISRFKKGDHECGVREEVVVEADIVYAANLLDASQNIEALLFVSSTRVRLDQWVRSNLVLFPDHIAEEGPLNLCTNNLPDLVLIQASCHIKFVELHD